MVIEILLIISVVLQIVAAIVAIGLIRRTKYNLSWMLFTVALTCMAFMRLAEYVQITSLKTILRLPPEFFVWMGVVTSLCVKGFILKNSDIKDVVAAIEAVVEGGSFFSQELLFNLVSNLKSAPSAVPDDSAEQLSQRESEILLHICRGESNNEIADALFISKRTVDKHRSNILAKTGCKNTANLVVYAIKNNLVEI